MSFEKSKQGYGQKQVMITQIALSYLSIEFIT